jgi:hypothetical protein
MSHRRMGVLLGSLQLAFSVLAVTMARARAAPHVDLGDEEVDQGQLAPGFARHPLFIEVHGRDARGAPLVTNSTPTGYTPAQIAAYLGLAGGGGGQTIAIVDAFDDPKVQADLNTFSTTFGLPLICGSAGANPGNCLTFTKATPQGTPTKDAGWAARNIARRAVGARGRAAGGYPPRRDRVQLQRQPVCRHRLRGPARRRGDQQQLGRTGVQR